MNSACRDKHCAGVVRAGVCSVCGAQRRPRQLDPRPPASQRGYDRRWRRIRNAVLAEEPLCRHCAAAVLVDHILPQPAGTHDRENLQPLCQQCHAVKTAGERQLEG